MSFSRRNVVIIGSSGHARVVIDILEQSTTLNLVGLLDDFRNTGDLTDGYRVLGKTEDLPVIAKSHGVDAAFVAVGDNWARHCVVERIANIIPSIKFPAVIHPRACIASTAKIEDGCMIMANAVICSGSHLKRFCIVNTAATLDHDGVMEEFSSLAPGVHTGGNVQIGTYSSVSIGATIIQGRKIGEHCVIGAGAVVIKDIPDYSLALGVPAKAVRQREPGECYL